MCHGSARLSCGWLCVVCAWARGDPGYGGKWTGWLGAPARSLHATRLGATAVRIHWGISQRPVRVDCGLSYTAVQARLWLVIITITGQYYWQSRHPIVATGSMHAVSLNLDDNAILVAVGLRLGSAICEAHTCPCGAMVDSLGQHALSCKKHPGRLQRHARINDLIHRALIMATLCNT